MPIQQYYYSLSHRRFGQPLNYPLSLSSCPSFWLVRCLPCDAHGFPSRGLRRIVTISETVGPYTASASSYRWRWVLHFRSRRSLEHTRARTLRAMLLRCLVWRFAVNVYTCHLNWPLRAMMSWLNDSCRPLLNFAHVADYALSYNVKFPLYGVQFVRR